MGSGSNDNNKPILEVFGNDILSNLCFILVSLFNRARLKTTSMCNTRHGCVVYRSNANSKLTETKIIVEIIKPFENKRELLGGKSKTKVSDIYTLYAIFL